MQGLGWLDDFKAICSRYGADMRDVYCAARGMAHVCHARQDIMLYLREVVGWSYPAIGRFLHRDHTSVIFGCKQSRQRIEERRKKR